MFRLVSSDGRASPNKNSPDTHKLMTKCPQIGEQRPIIRQTNAHKLAAKRSFYSVNKHIAQQMFTMIGDQTPINRRKAPTDWRKFDLISVRKYFIPIMVVLRFHGNLRYILDIL